MVPEVVKCARCASNWLQDNSKPIKMMSVCFIALFFGYASAYLVKVPGNFKQKKSFDGGITILRDGDTARIPVKARILIQDIIAAYGKFNAFVLLKALHQFCVPEQARIISWEGCGFRSVLVVCIRADLEFQW